MRTIPLTEAYASSTKRSAKPAQVSSPTTPRYARPVILCGRDSPARGTARRHDPWQRSSPHPSATDEHDQPVGLEGDGILRGEGRSVGFIRFGCRHALALGQLSHLDTVAVAQYEGPTIETTS